MARRSPTFGQYLLAALPAGALGVALFFVPGISLINYCCCLGIVLSALLAGFILTRLIGNGITIGEGLAVGTLTGVLAGLGFTAVLTALFTNPAFRDAYRQEMLRNPLVTGGAQQQQMEQMLSVIAGPVGGLLIGLFATVLCVMFGLLGGLFAALLWKPRPPLATYQPPAPPSVPPPPPPPAAPTA